MKGRKASRSESDDDWGEEPRYKSGAKERGSRRNVVAQQARSTGRSRPTNNQLLYKAYFRWNHYAFKLRSGASMLPTETDACASVTAAFLQVLHTLHIAEQQRVGDARNILQILSNNTRRTKVVELSTGTHRVPDELRKHYLSDGETGQYSTNLDRNRYGNDDQYLFTVVRYDLEYLGLCPCMVDVEIIDAKNDNQSIFVSAGPEACSCHRLPPPPLRTLQDPALMAARAAAANGGGQYYGLLPGGSGGGGGGGGGAAYALPPGVLGSGGGGGGGGGGGRAESPKRSGSGMSQLFDALVMAATGGTDGAAAAALGGEPPVDSRMPSGGAVVAGLAAAAAAGTGASAAPLLLGSGGIAPGGGAPTGTSPAAAAAAAASSAAAAVAAAAAAAAGTAVAPPGRQHNMPARQRSRLWSALSYGDADSLQNALDAFRAEEEIVSGGPALSDALGAATGEVGFRKRQRKPVRGPSSGNLAALAGMDSGLLGSLLKGSAISGLKEKSGDNVAGGDMVSSGHAGGGDGASAGDGADAEGGDSDEQAGGGGVEGGGTSGDAPHHAGDSGERLGAGDDAGGGAGAAGDDAPGDGPREGAGEADNDAGDLAGAAGNLGAEPEARMPLGADGGPLSRRVRHVPRQSSAVNLGTRVGPAEVKRLAAEVDGLRQDNARLEAALRRANDGASTEPRLRQLEQEMLLMRGEMLELARAKQAADERVLQLTTELTTTRATANQVLQRLLANGHGLPLAGAPGAPPAPPPVPGAEPAPALVGAAHDDARPPLAGSKRPLHTGGGPQGEGTRGEGEEGSGGGSGGGHGSDGSSGGSDGEPPPKRMAVEAAVADGDAGLPAAVVGGVACGPAELPSQPKEEALAGA